MESNKKVKLTNKLKNLGPKLKWQLFTELKDFKLASDYIDFICPETSKKVSDPIQDMRNMIKESLVREFSPEIQNSKSFELLVDAVMNNLQKKSLEKSS